MPFRDYTAKTISLYPKIYLQSCSNKEKKNGTRNPYIAEGEEESFWIP